MPNRLTSNYIVHRLSEEGIRCLRADEFQGLFGLSSARGNQILHRMSRAGWLLRIGRGRYLVVGPMEAPSTSQPLYIGTRLVEPSYVSFWSALHYRGWTEQAPRVTMLATSRRGGTRKVGSYLFRAVHVRPDRFFGYELAHDGALDFPMAEPEKALLDSLLLPERSGGMRLVLASWAEAWSEVDPTRLRAYALRMGSRSLVSRLGHLLRSRGEPADDLRGHRSSAFVKLDPRGPRRGLYDATWRVVANMQEAEP